MPREPGCFRPREPEAAFWFPNRFRFPCWASVSVDWQWPAVGETDGAPFVRQDRKSLIVLLRRPTHATRKWLGMVGRAHPSGLSIVSS